MQTVTTSTPRGDRTSDAEVKRRTGVVTKLIVEGRSTSEIAARCCAEMAVCERTVDSYIALAKQGLRETWAKDTSAEAALAKQRLEDIYRGAMAEQDYSAAISSVRELVKLMGLAAPDKIEHSTSDPVAFFLATLVDRKDSPR